MENEDNEIDLHIKSLIKEYIAEHLDIRVNIRPSYDYGYGNSYELEVSLYLGDECVANDTHSLPTPKVSY